MLIFKNFEIGILKTQTLFYFCSGYFQKCQAVTQSNSDCIFAYRICPLMYIPSSRTIRGNVSSRDLAALTIPFATVAQFTMILHMQA